MKIDRLTKPQQISGIAILVVIIAAFLPWVSIFGISVIGVEGDGVITLLLAVAGGATLAITSGVVGGDRKPGRAANIVLLVLASLVAFIGLVDMNGAAAMGLYLTLFAGFAWVVGAIWQLNLAASGSSAPGNGPSGQD